MFLKNRLNYLEKSVRLEKKIHNLISKPYLIDRPTGKKVLVLAPHFDDEIFGCGGVLRKHVLDHDLISIIYLTSDARNQSDKHRTDYFTVRKNESAKACRLLGINDQAFFHLKEPECQLSISQATIKTAGQLIKTINPDLIYLPWFLDNHVDHFKTNQLLYLCRRQLDPSVQICAYEIWTPLIPNTIVDISQEWPLKKQAMACFLSQLAQVKYDLVFEGLNRYRTAFFLGGSGYAEAFLCLPIKDYFALTK